MDIKDLAKLTAAELDEVRRQVEPLRSLGDLLDWARRLSPPVACPAVVTQDEYTHDVLIPYDDRRWLDFDTT
jgi:hypothetical protein